MATGVTDRAPVFFAKKDCFLSVPIVFAPPILRGYNLLMHSPAIETTNLGRTYRRARTERPMPKSEVVALADVTLTVPAGELFGLLGPNGAGKTTLIKILATLLAPTQGSARVAGFDVVRDMRQIRRCINMVSGGESSGYGLLTVRENLWLFSQLYGIPSKEALHRIDTLLKVVDLTDLAHTKISRISTGQRQRMNFCRGFVTDPKILFLDEPTLGLDVRAARNLRRFVKDWLAEHPDRTILLTTHYMAEADELCNRLAIIDHGRILACDTPFALKRRLQRHCHFEVVVPEDNRDHRHELSEVAGVQQCVSELHTTGMLLKLVLEEESVVGPVIQRLLAGGSQIISLTKVAPTLEDAFLDIVGHGLAEEDRKYG